MLPRALARAREIYGLTSKTKHATLKNAPARILPSCCSRRLHNTPSSFLTTTTSKAHDPCESQRLLDEENNPQYDKEEFYPARVGDLIKCRYRIIGKLGYSTNSTVWFCRDVVTSDYVALKVNIQTPAGKLNRETIFYDHISTMTTTHPGCLFIQQIVDKFKLAGKDGAVHECLVHPPLQTTVFALQRVGGNRRPFTEALAKVQTISLLMALDFLHTEADVTHCDLKLSNMMLTVADESVYADYENTVATNPCDRKVIDEHRTIYASRPFRSPHKNSYGYPMLCDFGEARIGSKQTPYNIQPDIYKAPETLMELEWGHPVDIWNTACVLWEMVEVEHLFDGYSDEGRHNNKFHMHEIVCLIGEPLSEFLERSPHTWRLFDDQGKWKNEPPIKSASLKNRSKNLEGESQALFLDFMSCMLRWLPEQRLTARQLLQHPWLEGV